MAKRKAAPKPRQSVSDWQRGIEERLEAVEAERRRREEHATARARRINDAISQWREALRQDLSPSRVERLERLPWYIRGSEYDRRRNGR